MFCSSLNFLKPWILDSQHLSVKVPDTWVALLSWSRSSVFAQLGAKGSSTKGSKYRTLWNPMAMSMQNDWVCGMRPMGWGLAALESHSGEFVALHNVIQINCNFYDQDPSLINMVTIPLQRWVIRTG